MTPREALQRAGRALTLQAIAQACGLSDPDASDALENMIDAGTVEYDEKLDCYRLTKANGTQAEPPAPPAAPKRRPTIPESIITCLRAFGPVMTSAHIRELLADRAPTSVTTELSKMVKRGDLVRVQDGVFRLATDADVAPEADPPAPTTKVEKINMPAPESPALARQEGGDHYKDMAIQPFEYIHANRIGFGEGCVIKYVSRWRSKGGVEDLKKARHFLDLLIEAEERP